jgi:hypothetical protein
MRVVDDKRIDTQVCNIWRETTNKTKEMRWLELLG